MLNKKRLIVLLASTIAVIAVFVTLIVLIVNLSRIPSTNYIAKKTNISITNDANIFIFKDAMQVNANMANHLVYAVNNGDSVKKNDVIAYIFPNAKESQITKLEELNNELTISKLYEEYSSLSLTELEEKINEINSILASINQEKNTNTYLKYSNTLKALALLRKDYYSPKEDFSIKSTSIEKSISSTLIEMGTKLEILAPSSGIFLKSSDGYEDTMNLTNIGKLNFSNYTDYVFATADCSSSVGSIIKDNTIKFVCFVDTKEFTEYKKGNSYKISFDNETSILSTLDEKIDDAQTGKTKLVFSAKQTDINMITNRNFNVTIEEKAIEGIVFSKNDLYTIRGESCVYVLDENNKARIRQVNIIFESGTNYISSLTITNPKYTALQPGEKIISGEYRIYDGKVIS